MITNYGNNLLEAAKALKEGNSVQIRPRGNSMSGRIDDKSLVTLDPIKDQVLEVGDIVLVRVSGKIYLHLIKAINGDRYQIGNNHGRINGWAPRYNVFGIVVKVEK